MTEAEFGGGVKALFKRFAGHMFKGMGPPAPATEDLSAYHCLIIAEVGQDCQIDMEPELGMFQDPLDLDTPDPDAEVPSSIIPLPPKILPKHLTKPDAAFVTQLEKWFLAVFGRLVSQS